MHHFSYRAGVMHAEDVDLRALAEEVGTPFYCYSSATFARHYRVFAEAFADRDALVCYAMKANANQALLRTLGNLGAGMDIVSEGELRRALAAGVPGERIVFSGVGKTRPEMAFALESGILCFNVESEPELEALAEVSRSKGLHAPVSIRVNPDVDARTHRKISTGRSENKFGIPISRAREVYARAAALDGVTVTGVDMHIGSQITDLEPFDNATALLAELARDLMGAGHRLHHIDLGGGLGIPYRDDNEPPPDPHAYAAIIKRHTADLGLKLVFEMGRLIAGNAGVLVTRVIYVKEGEGKTFRDRRRGHERPHPPDPLRRPPRDPPRGGAGPRHGPHHRRHRRAGLRERRLSGAEPRDARGAARRPPRRDDGRRLRGRAGQHLQHPPPRPGGAGAGGRACGGAPPPLLRPAHRARPRAGLALRPRHLSRTGPSGSDGCRAGSEAGAPLARGPHDSVPF
jgi:diaminopimelate decarboxylase